MPFCANSPNVAEPARQGTALGTEAGSFRGQRRLTCDNGSMAGGLTAGADSVRADDGSGLPLTLSEAGASAPAPATFGLVPADPRPCSPALGVPDTRRVLPAGFAELDLSVVFFRSLETLFRDNLVGAFFGGGGTLVVVDDAAVVVLDAFAAEEGGI